MAMDHNLYSQDLEENIELRNYQFRWLFGKKYHKFDKVSEALYSQLSRKRPALVHDKVEIRAILYCISYNHLDHARWTLTGNRICQMSGLKSGRGC